MGLYLKGAFQVKKHLRYEACFIVGYQLIISPLLCRGDCCNDLFLISELSTRGGLQ